MNNDDLFNFLVATDTLDDFLGYKDPNKNQTTDEEIEEIEDIDEVDEENIDDDDDEDIDEID